MKRGNASKKRLTSWRIADLCELITDGTHKTPKYVESGIPFISTANIVPFRPFKFDSYRRFISQNEHIELTRRCKPESGDVLVSKIGTLGLSKLVDVEYDFSIFVGLALLKLRRGIVDGTFLEQLLNTEECKKAMVVASPGSTRSTLTLSAIQKLEVLLPSLESQTKIAEVLSTVDRAIDKTEALIGKQQRIKTGLMQDLLTRGIDEHGNLRSQQTSQFKDSPLGRIPVEWVVKPLQSIAPVFDSLHRTPSFAEDGYAMVRVTDIKEGELDINDCARVSKRIYDEFTTNHKPQISDIVLSRVGSYGISSYVDTKEPFCMGQNTVVITGHANSKFLFEYLQTNVVKDFFDLELAGSSQKTLSLRAIRATPTPVLSEDEMGRIVNVFNCSRIQIKNETARLAKLQKLKSGLMQDLLAGKVSVTRLLKRKGEITGAS